MANAVIYARKSTQSDGRQVQSLGDQDVACRRAAADAGDRIIRVYKDSASGTDVEGREGFRKLLADAGNGCDFERVYCYDVERFSRGGAMEAPHCLHELQECGIEVVFVAEGFRGDDTDELLFGVRGWQAGQFSKDLSRKTARGMASAFQDFVEINGGGKATKIGQIPPWGYDQLHVDPDGTPVRRVRFVPIRGKKACPRWRKEVTDLATGQVQVYEPDERVPRSDRERTGWVPSAPERVRAVQEVLRCYLGGSGALRIAKHMNKLVLPSPSGRPWTVSTVQHILENEAYTGVLVWNKQSSAKFHRVEKVGEGAYAPQRRAKKLKSVRGPARSVKNSAEHVKRLDDAHEALISRKDWEEARAIRLRRSETRGGYAGSWGRRKHFYALSGLVRCERCGKTWVGGTDKRKNRRYRCSGGSSGHDCRRNVTVSADIMDGFVIEEIGRRVRRLFDPTDLAGDLARPDDTQDRAKEILATREAALEAVKIRSARALDLLLDAPELDASLREKIREFEVERVRLEAEIAELRESAPSHHVNESGPTSEEVARLLDDFNRVFDKGSWEERRDFVRCFLDGALVKPENRTVEFRFYRTPRSAGIDTRRAEARVAIPAPTSGIARTSAPAHSYARGWALS